MNLKVRLPALQKQRDNLTLAERAELSCDLAKEFEKAGDYDAACKALAEFWPEANQPPNVQGLDETKDGIQVAHHARLFFSSQV